MDTTDSADTIARRFDSICVILDPHSTGDAPELAEKAPGPAAVAPAPAAPEPLAPAPAPGAPEPAPAAPGVPAGGFANCTEARAAGAAPIYGGSPGYAPKPDRDGDRIACE